ncbi:MAG: BBP7 family outer membrane beta-barrel protein [Gemmataceae bacterium]|nr:BBP7 family outer membrane beta-barrel protein [Gemmataceae bacterium]
MARRWKIAAWMVAWLGAALTAQAQTPPPPLPVGPSGGGFPIAQPRPVGPMGPMGPMAPMGPMGPMGPWKGPPPGGQRPPMPPLPPGAQLPHGAEGESLDLDAKTVSHNAFNEHDGGDYIPIAHEFRLEYLILWFKGHRHPTLVTSGNSLDPIPGALDQPGTVVLHGERSGAGASSALRVTYTYWLVDPEIVSLDASFMIMEQRRVLFTAASDSAGNPVLTRPFFNPTASAEDADPRALPFVMRGSVEDSFLTRMMGAEANFKYNVSGRPCSQGPSFTIFTGPRWIKLDETYANNDFSQDIPSGTGETRRFMDNVTCYNEFIGAQVGGSFRCRWDRLTFDLTSKIAVGQNFQTLKASGRTVIANDAFGDRIAFNEGLYVQSTNSGVDRFEHVSVVPEVDVTVGIALTDSCKFTFGYGIFFMNNVIRPGALLDRRIEIQPAGIPTTFPLRTFNTTDFWAQWVSFGLEFSY